MNPTLPLPLALVCFVKDEYMFVTLQVLPQTNFEILATTFIMVAGACVLIVLLGSVASMLNTMDSQQKEYYKLRDTLNDFTATNNLPPALCYKLRHYFRSRFESGALTDWSPVLGRMSKQLKVTMKILLSLESSSSPVSCDHEPWFVGGNFNTPSREMDQQLQILQRCQC